MRVDIFFKDPAAGHCVQCEVRQRIGMIQMIREAYYGLACGEKPLLKGLFFLHLLHNKVCGESVGALQCQTS